MKKLILLALTLCFVPMVKAQTNQTTLDEVLAKFGGTPTNYALVPYMTYAPKAKTKIGGGAEVAYNFNQYVGMSLALDWLGQFSLVSGNVTLGLPFHPAASFFPNLITTPFIQAGVATAYSGAGKFNGNASTTTEIGDYIKFGHLWKGQFLAGAAWGQWSNVGPAYGGTRYHIFFGWSKGF